jgi:RNA polymerase sigma factor (sigma-70 family)
MPSPSTVLLRTQSDARLVALARTGHDRAFEAIVERYRRQLLRACLRILPEARAEDALQQALVAAWTALRRGDEVLELRPWLYRVARNTALNQLRMAGYDLDELVDTLGAASDPEEEVARRAVVRQTLAAVAALPERQRDALLRTAVQGRGQDEVARDLGLTDTAVRQLVHRARMALRATATAAVPLPAAAWFASAGARAEPMAGRIAELVTGAGTAGATMTLAKAGTVAVLAGGAIATPAVVSDRSADHRAARARPAATAAPREAAVVAAPRRVAAPVATATATPVHVAKPAPRTATPVVRERTKPVEADRRDQSEQRGRDEHRTSERRDDGGGDRSAPSAHEDDFEQTQLTPPPPAPPSGDDGESSTVPTSGGDSGDELAHREDSPSGHDAEPEHD